MGIAEFIGINTTCLRVPQASTCCRSYSETYRPSSTKTAVDMPSYRHELQGVKRSQVAWESIIMERYSTSLTISVFEEFIIKGTFQMPVIFCSHYLQKTQ